MVTQAFGADPNRLDHGGRHRMVNDAEGQRWHIVEAGDPRNTTVVLVAGFPQSAYAWRRVIPLLAGQFHVVAVDLPGQGYSPAPSGGFDTKTTSRRLHSLLSEIGVTKHVYVGHDVGAWVGFAHAYLHHEHLLGVALLDANIAGVTLPSSIELGPDNWRNWHFLFNAIQDLPEALLTGRERVLIEWFFAGKTANWKETFSVQDIDEYERAYATPGVLRGMLGYYRSVLQDIQDHAELARDRISVPVLALGGDVGSAPDLFARLKPMCEDIRGGQIANSGHYIPEEQPEALVQELRSFIAAVV